jgi:hypothetical protein
MINVRIVNFSEYLIDFIISMFMGGNKANQNFILDNKFPEFVTEILKIKKIDN